ncbi:hypothetical protein A2313_00305 [Candidatus Roizmanbacteria bacterium RIFOXYB2_FULL_41_10]|uniref:CBS domain-containing protein n=1 Tax=Candidatus Roizmanbacteria bacterium RIFOXYA1_FULL_41_12 TaxID=1802082 RepID=A0A1F7KAM0_9BACT|nr:MAG: hypothetical protein A2262_01300 [Candidatus Roizmanbacteria bacterium RIFOXYA2_FULL_41_8]OGK64912.1 MAG: hypothetical protein A2209_04415 [Candidatus Roizmanbacteria bacterium RIFOXYA1_FULL_41_12]OGK66827.1 MAG: hypothetical protein A2377_02910 [Candidatus Roizmanbacteria bacterium RIFOXYB1_FULL_41_27]OGK70799.1 MAG: hypothetical protein A2403_01795 [Candidatus Roizmanbacteria bacterium RIFOXYC1_FULL_41_16]OGK71409.1 MAG: hypothetical protein A2313_00305 [Candidatus Roizmanbacteria bac
MKAKSQPNRGITAKDILKTQGIISLSPDDKLAEAISKFKSSHDAVMVTEQGQYLGLINSYFTLTKRNYPVSAKLKKCLFSPPKLNLDTKIEEIARLMLESKVHYLPVLDSANQMLGIVTARRVLRSQLNNAKATRAVSDLVDNKHHLQSINLNSSFEEVLRFFQRSKLSKIVIVNQENNLQGIVSLFDLLPLFNEPKERMGFFDRGEPVNQLAKYTIKHVLKTVTIQVAPEQKISEVIKLILDKEIGSVIVMKNRFQPLNIITTSDLLRYLFKSNSKRSTRSAN